MAFVDRDHTKVLTFIENYKSFVELWDASHKDYNNKNKRSGALECLAINHNMSIPEVKNKIKSLRSYFSKEHQKVLKRSNDDYESSWFAYKPMLFILAKSPKPLIPSGEEQETTDVSSTFNLQFLLS